MLITQTLEKASAHERTALSNVATKAVLEDLQSFDEPTKKSGAARLLASDLPRLADRERVFTFFGRTAPNSLRDHATFPDYLGDLVRRWLDYIRTARTKRPGAIIDIGFAVSQSVLDVLHEQLRGIDLQGRRTERPWGNGPSEVVPEISIENYERCVGLLSDLLLPLLAGGRAGRVVKAINGATSTHGIYMPVSATDAQSEVARRLTEQRWPESATLPGQHKVLLCMGAIDRFKKNLVEGGSDPDEAEALARDFSVSILVHEHFHAAIATGLDAAGHAAFGTEHSERWATAVPLNESLAVWCERHFFRSHPKMLELIDGYVATGPYPTWPYRGAQVVESLHTAGGTPAVRRWMRHLRDDPENAQREFDQRALAK